MLPVILVAVGAYLIGDSLLEDKKYAKGGETKSKKRYTVNVYHGGEMEDEEFYTDSLIEAKKLGQKGEHSEIYDNVEKEFIEEYAQGGVMPKGAKSGIKIKNWYVKNYPTDELGEEINDTITFKGYWAMTSQGYNPYEVLGVHDSVVRERVEEKLSQILGIKNFEYKKGGELAFENSNLYLSGFGIDTNGNRVVKVSFPNSRAFSIQTNGVLKETNNLYTKNIDGLTDSEKKTIEKEVIEYVKQFGSKEQKQKLKTYSGYMADGGELDKYTEVNGTFYQKGTPQAVINALESVRNNKTRVKLFYGDPETGRDWHEENDVTGTIGRSTGSIKIPLLISTSRSMGGGAILTKNIVKIRDTKTGKVLYQNEKYKQPNIEIVESDMDGYTNNVMIDGELYSRHKTKRSAEMLKSKMMAKGGDIQGKTSSKEQDEQRFAKPTGARWKDKAVKKGVASKSDLSKSPSKKMQEKYPKLVYTETRSDKSDKNPSIKYKSI
jgi:hypothetical protein